ncbi:MAG TPA: LacI family DNA-binding transcriptional regulator [Fimbriimonas sp.]|nr:LacI family DNA-binding transcriptional regulator [Fimbriimonas sp.]
MERARWFMATIRQVANKAGVSIGTVSNVLNGRDERVDPATKARILESIRELRYRPPAFEQNQSAAVSENLGMIVPDLTERPLSRLGYLQGLLNGALEAAALRGWSVTIFAETMWDDVGNAIRRKYDGRCDAVLVAAPQPKGDLLPSLQRRGAPIVQIGSTPWLEDVSCVDIDNVEAGRLIARHFKELGHRRMGFISLGQDHVSGHERWQGFHEIAGDSAIRIVRESNEAFAQQLHDMGDARPTALLGWHDGILADIVPALEDAGLRVPQDVSVAGVDAAKDILEAGFDFTSVENPLQEIGKLAANMAIDRALDPNMPSETVRLRPRLIVRSSTAPLMEQVAV